MVCDIGNVVKEIEKPKKILVIGNGFDIHHYLPTRYMDFLAVVKRLLELNKENRLHDCMYLKYMFGEESPVCKESAYIQECNKIHSDTLRQTRLNDESLKQIVRIAENNIWFEYFFEMFPVESGWIDFEKEIAKIASAVSHFFKIVRLDEQKAFQRGVGASDEELSLEEYTILKMFPKLFTNIGYMTLMVNDEYIIFNHEHEEIKIDESKIAEKMRESLEDLSHALTLYMEEFVQKITTNKKSDNDKLFESMEAVINFNYTNTFSRLYDENTPAYYIHGSVEKRNIVLGINADDEDDLENLDLRFIFLKKYYQRVQKNTVYNYTECLKGSKNYELYFVGHSLDVTDRDILTSLIANENVKSIFYYHKESSRNQLIINLIGLFGKAKFESLLFSKRIKFEALLPFRDKSR